MKEFFDDTETVIFSLAVLTLGIYALIVHFIGE
jgi:hypothetical protein